MRIPMLDLERIHHPIEAELAEAFQRVLKKNAYIMGEEVRNFEIACEKYLGVKHAIGVSSGTDALLLALMSLDIGPGDEVICPSYTFFATAGCISRLGARPVFVDIDPKTYNWDLESVFAARTQRTKAVIPVHLFGQVADMDALSSWSKEFQIPVIEDAAQAIGAEWHGKKAGSMGDFGCFSFFPSKNLGALGDGGLLVTQNEALAERARVLRVHGAKPKYVHHFVGGNFRLDALQAAFLSIKLQHLETYTSQRQAVAENYFSQFHNESAFESIQLPLIAANRKHVMNQFVIRFKTHNERELVRSHLSERGIASAIYYPKPLHLQACFQDLGYSNEDLPHSIHASQTSLAIPIFPGMTETEQKEVIEAIVQALKA